MRMRKRQTGRRRLLSIVTVLFVLVVTTIAHAQVNEGAIGGNIQDPLGSLIAGASVTAVETASGTTYTTSSTSAGSYRFPQVRTGTYRVAVTAAGFKNQKLEGVIVNVGTTTALNITLTVGAASGETITVVADAQTVNTETSEVSGVITEKEQTDLPLNLNGGTVSNMRSPEAFVFTMPGTVGPGTSNGSGPTFETKLSGGQNYSTEVLLDGASMYRSENGSSFDETAPSIEALTEYKVYLSTPSAEIGRTTGGVESFSTKGGTNDFHGVVYELYKDTALDATNWGYGVPGYIAPKDKDHKNDYGVTLGGPVRIPHLYNGRDKSFFFFSWEQYRQNTGGATTSTVPTSDQLNGDFSAYLTTTVAETYNPCVGGPTYRGQIFDPSSTQTVTYNGVTETCRTPFAGNKIPLSTWRAAHMDSTTQGIVGNLTGYYPTATNSSQSAITNNYVYSWSYPILDTAMTVRVDQNLTAQQKMYFTYNSRENARTSTTPWNPLVSGAGRHQSFVTHYIRYGYDYSIKSNLLNHLNLGYNRTNSGNYGAGIAFGGGWDNKIGLANGGGRTFPGIAVDGYAGMGDTVDGDTRDNGYRLNDTLEWTRGRHDIKVGGDFRYQIFTPGSEDNNSGTLGFQTYTTSGSTSTEGITGNAFASLLLGQLGYSNLTAYDKQPKWLSHYYSVFAQDSFKILPNFTVNYGLRWDVDIPRSEAHDNTSNIDLTVANAGAGGLPGALVFAGKGTGRTGKTGETWVDAWHKDFGPRVGFVWSPRKLDNSLAVHGGYGILYAANDYADFGTDLRTGFEATPSWVSPDGFNSPYSLSTGFPSYTKPPSLDATQLNFQSPTYVSRDQGRPAMIQNWSMDVEQQLPGQSIFKIAYVAQHSTHLRSDTDPVNNLYPSNFDKGESLNNSLANLSLSGPYSGYPTGLTLGQSLRPYPQYLGFNTDCCLEARGQSTFNALEVTLKRRFSQGISLQAAYTWSKTLTDADSALPYFANLHGGGATQNPYNLKGEKSVSNQDTPQILVLTYMVELPFGKGKKLLNQNRVLDTVVGGWQVSGVQRYQSAQNISFYCATGVAGFGGCFRYTREDGQPYASVAKRSGHYDVARQDISTYNASTNPTPYRYFNYASLYDQNAADLVNQRGSFAFGNISRTTGEIRSFTYLDEDFSIMKRTRITERIALRFQADIIDAFNRHIFNRPTSDGPNNLTNFGFVSPTSMVSGPRNIQFLFKVEY